MFLFLFAACFFETVWDAGFERTLVLLVHDIRGVDWLFVPICVDVIEYIQFRAIHDVFIYF